MPDTRRWSFEKKRGPIEKKWIFGQKSGFLKGVKCFGLTELIKSGHLIQSCFKNSFTNIFNPKSLRFHQVRDEIDVALMRRR